MTKTKANGQLSHLHLLPQETEVRFFDLLDGNFLFAEDATNYRNTLIETKSGDSIAVYSHSEAACSSRQLIIGTSDCIHTCYCLKALGLKVAHGPYYHKRGLVCELFDGLNNFYLVRELRDYRFEMMI